MALLNLGAIKSEGNIKKVSATGFEAQRDENVR